MWEEYVINTKTNNLAPLFVGREACESGHNFGPYERDCYLVHFCISGKGVLKNQYGTFNIGEGQLFVIRPGEITTYTADKTNPWEYVWIAFRSDEIFFEDGNSVFDTPQGLDDKLIDIIREEQVSYEGCLSVIYSIIYHTARPNEVYAGDETVRRIRNYIKYNYMLPITVNSISKSFGFNRCHLYRTFKTKYGIGIKEYLTSIRMEKAKEFLKRGYSVKESAYMVGYEDEFNFSNAFQERYGIRPSKIKRLDKCCD